MGLQAWGCHALQHQTLNVGQLLTCQVLGDTPEERNRPIPHIPKRKGQARSRNSFSSAGRAEFPHNPGTRVKRHDPKCVTSPATVDPPDVGRPPTSHPPDQDGPSFPIRRGAFSLCVLLFVCNGLLAKLTHIEHLYVLLHISYL